MSYWAENNDLLERQPESEFVIKFLKQRVDDKIRRGLSGSFVLNIDATWGEGKTFFMKGLFADIKEAGHPAIMIDAWRDDFTGDPLTAVIAEFDQFLNRFKSQDRAVSTKVKKAGKELRRNVGKLSVLVGKSVAKNLVKRVVGDGTDEIIAAAKEVLPASATVDKFVDDATGEVFEFTDANIDKFAEKQLERFNEAKNSLANFQESLKHAVQALTTKDFNPPFFILVDELDRCRPTYAIEMLERIKHLFEVENVVFVLSTDTTQLSNSIKAVYGNDFDSRHYLARFFDRSYMLAAPNRRKMIRWLFENANVDTTRVSTHIQIHLVQIVEEISAQFGLEIRQIQRAIDVLATIALVWESNAEIELAIIFPMIAAFLRGNDLSDPKKLNDVFLPVVSNNTRSRHIANFNIGAVFQNLLPYGKMTLREVEREITRRGTGGPEDPSSVAYQILRSEYSATREGSAKPLFTTYAQRVRMAGRFQSGHEE
ncbi:KAP family NTPase [Neorhizobium galegae]|uniref:KAP family P-loop NTPase fold protein n=1 Tax=Neorhizobium galegae TaxID=399 RepID=UPI00210358A7|nr:P-loop NTPase fold protein [Neorhizobium galegae]MCQ1779112.1 KAP family NTPase [Neorhizobium galegae]MCQ1799213.1 KAP family NTPase [Neorhizobium galegae]